MRSNLLELYLRLRYPILLLILSVLVTPCLHATSTGLPLDFKVEPVTYGGAGGGISRGEAQFLRRYPVIMIPDIGRDHRDWTGSNVGNTSLPDDGNIYKNFIQAGFNPIELWMIDFARAGEQMSSIEEATDDLKYFICAVLQYTGAEKVQLLAHGAGCLLARLTIQKYSIAHFVESEVYIAGPFHGLASTNANMSLRGYPNSWALTADSDLLREILAKGESPFFYDPNMQKKFKLRAMTIRSFAGTTDSVFAGNPDSPALMGAQNIEMPGLNYDALRCSDASAKFFIPFLTHKTQPMKPKEDQDMDGFKGSKYGGPDTRDDDPDIYPGALEIPDDGIDQDCNGCDLIPELARDCEVPLF